MKKKKVANKKKLVVVGSGGREHALAHALSREAEVVVTPGRTSIPGSVQTPAEELEADLFVIGPEAPLVDGLADRLRSQDKLVLGPGDDGAQLEGSKIWMKRLLTEAGVPTAPWDAFFPDHQAEAEEYLRAMSPPYVVKTDYLAAGKGALVTSDLGEAIDDAKAKLKKGGIVIEEGLTGLELSVTALCDGRSAMLLPASRDHKRLYDGDQGPMTGGVGAFSPVTDIPSPYELLELVQKTLTALRRRGIDYRGILYAGLMLTPAGPMMLEYNIRFGDPETQVVLPRLGTGLLDSFMQAAQGKLLRLPPVSNDTAVCVTLTAEGYPDDPKTGDVISGLDAASRLEGVTIYHAGTVLEDGRYLTASGRVLNVVAVGADIDQARERAYAAAELISFRGMQPYRRDIGLPVSMPSRP